VTNDGGGGGGGWIVGWWWWVEKNVMDNVWQRVVIINNQCFNY